MDSYNEKYKKKKSSIRKIYSLISTPGQINIQKIYFEFQQSIDNSSPNAVRIPERFYS